MIIPLLLIKVVGGSDDGALACTARLHYLHSVADSIACPGALLDGAEPVVHVGGGIHHVPLQVTILELLSLTQSCGMRLSKTRQLGRCSMKEAYAYNLFCFE